jgi:hypothetical protein
MATWEEASKCPKCGEPGEETNRSAAVVSGRPTGSVITLTCRNERCQWLNTSWIVQVDRNGTIPERQGGGDKQFPNLTPGQEAMARRMLEDVAAEDESGASLQLLRQIEEGRR